MPPFPMSALTHSSHSSWTQLQNELRELAFVLDRQGNPVAADVASNIAARIDEVLTDEVSPARNPESAPERLSA